MQVDGIQKILIIKWGALGDMIAGTPAIKAVRAAFPKASITLLSNSLMREIAPPGTLADEVLIHDEYLLRELFRELRRRRFDLAINLRWTSDRSAFLTWLSGARYRVSSGPKNLMFLYNIRIPHPKRRYHEIHRNTDIIKALGIHVEDETPFLFRSVDDLEFAEKFFSNHGLTGENIFGMHPGASKVQKAWLSERFIEVGKKFIEKFHQPILITWGPGERELASSVAQAFGSYGILSEETKRVGQLAALIERCKLFLCNCSGPMNVAMAVQTPIIALLGSTHPDDWRPYGESHRTIKSSYIRETYTNTEEQFAMQCITVDEVWNVVDQRWQELNALSIVKA